ncbi:MAG: ferrous iron transporter B [Candidatus Krumholzibacteriota bacterium]|nr:ferrous iron transporter B [Candidatus Krumholzibacteriota bacterium]
MIAEQKDKILLVGNPNVGKSVVFAYLTGTYTVVSNYPGTTVEVSKGFMKHQPGVEVIDTPGINSLFPQSEDEKVTRDILLHSREATIVQVVDAKNILRGLLLTTQLAELGCRTILVLNMMDEARQRRLNIDMEKLSGLLGIEVIETVAVEKRGLSRLADALKSNLARIPSISVEYSSALNKIIAETDEDISGINRWGLFGTLSFIAGDYQMLVPDDAGAREKLHGAKEKLIALEGKLSEPLSFHMASARKELADQILSRTVYKDTVGPREISVRWKHYLLPLAIAVFTVILHLFLGREGMWSAGLYPTLPVLILTTLGIILGGAERINYLTLHPLFGLFFFVLVIYLIFVLVGVFAAGSLVGLLENRLFGGLILPPLRGVLPSGFIHDLLVGQYGLISVGLNYAISIVLPIVVVFFLVFGILEDTGYFPRLTVLTNNAFKIVGVNGKATLPIVLGFGCVTMAVLASRIVESRRDRIIIVTLLALAVPCSAQLGILMALMAAISIPAVILIVSILVAEFLLVGYATGRIMGGKASDFILELPPLRAPQLKNIIRKTGARAKWFLREAFPYFLVATLILFLLDRSGGLKIIYRLAEPVTVRLLGLPVETASIFIVGFFRRDYGAAGLLSLIEQGSLDGNQVVVSLVVLSLFLPCLATLIVMIKELGLRTALIIFLFVLATSLLSGGALNYLLHLLRIEF